MMANEESARTAKRDSESSERINNLTPTASYRYQQQSGSSERTNIMSGAAERAPFEDKGEDNLFVEETQAQRSRVAQLSKNTLSRHPSPQSASYALAAPMSNETATPDQTLRVEDKYVRHIIGHQGQTRYYFERTYNCKIIIVEDADDSRYQTLKYYGDPGSNWTNLLERLNAIMGAGPQ